MMYLSSRPGRYDVWYELVSDDDASDTYLIPKLEDSLAQTYFVQGLSVSKLYPENKETAQPGYISESDLAAGVGINHYIQMDGLAPNTTYSVSSYLAKLDIGERYTAVSRLGATNSTTFTSDETGGAEHTYPIAIPDNLEAGNFYTIMFTVTNTSNPNERYSYTYNDTYTFILQDDPERLFAVMFDSDAEETTPEEPTKAKVSILKKDRDTGDILEGATLKIVKGESADGEEVHSFKSGKEPYEYELGIGTYTLVESSPPTGYKNDSQPITFTLSGDDADDRNYPFEAYTKTLEAEEGIYFDVLHVRKEGSAETGEVSYCINNGRLNPSPVDAFNMSKLTYTEYDLLTDDVEGFFAAPRVSLDEMRTKLARVMYGGYPNDGLGLKAKYGLDDKVFENITQLAVHYYTDQRESYLSTFNNVEAHYQAYLDLINSETDAPEGFTVKVYVPSNNLFQSVVSTHFRKAENVMALEITDTKEDAEEEEKDDGEDDEKSEDKEDSPEKTEDDGSDESGTGQVEAGDKVTETTPDTGDELPVGATFALLCAALATIMRLRPTY